MLILTRTLGEAVNIGDDIEIRVLAVKGRQARIGITAPDGVNILREELVELEDLPDSHHTE